MPAANAVFTRFLCVAATGAIMMYGSEMLFWSVPPDDSSATGLAVTWLAYSLCAYAFLALLVRYQVSSLHGLFLCGAIYGWLIEGVIVEEMYLSFPFQLAWTPLAWHALITAPLLFWLSRLSAAWPATRQVALLVAMGMGFGLWAMWWPAERQPMPGPAVSLLYLVGLAAFPVAAQWLIDRYGKSLLAISTTEFYVVFAIFAALWLMRFAAAPRWEMLTCPLLIAIALWALGRQPPGPPLLPHWLEPPPQPLRHALFLAVPLIAAAIASTTWTLGFAPPTNIAVATVTVALSLGLFANALRRAC
jgi:hypothetical protein